MRHTTCWMMVIFSLFFPLLGLADSQVNQMGSAFVKSLPAAWKSVQGSWNYFDVVDCYVNQPTCFGNNPTSPYGYPSFPDSTGTVSSFHLEPTSAVVMFLRTPPQMRYFGFTQYLMTRGAGQEFASLSDTLNQLEFSVLSPGGQTPSSVFNQYAVIVWTADLVSLASVEKQLALQGIPASQVNFIPLPINLPLNMGNDANADTFGMLMRTALPSVQADFDRYKTEKPFFIVKVDTGAPPMKAAPTIGYADTLSGVSEDPSLQSSLDTLVSGIKKNYARNFAISSASINSTEKTGWDCINTGKTCLGDNHDALYTIEGKPVTVSQLKDLVIIAGVNHQKTNKALYINHSVYDTVKLAGIVSVDDTQLTVESALYHAGIKNPTPAQLAQYANLYAYVISYDCTGLRYCLAIPAPTESNPVGLTPGAPFQMVGRAYVEPRTHVKPDPSEIVPHVMMIGTSRKPASQ